MGRLVSAEIDLACSAAFGRPFLWGRDDCYLFVAGIIERATGHDIARWCRGRYKTPLQAARLLKGYSGGDLDHAMALICADNDWPEIEPHEARAGDIGVIMAKGIRQALVIYDGAWWLGRDHYGVVFLQAELVGRAWGVQWRS